MKPRVEDILKLINQLSEEDRNNLVRELNPSQYIDPDFEDVITHMIENLRGNWRVSQPTKHELILTVFLERKGQGKGVPFEIIVSMYQDLKYPTQSATNALGQINNKLADSGWKIIRSSEYYLVRIE